MFSLIRRSFHSSPTCKQIIKMSRLRVVDNSEIGKLAMAEGKPPKCIHVYNKKGVGTIAEDYTGQIISIDYDSIEHDILENVYRCADEQKIKKNGIDGGLYTGLCGNAYTLLHLSQKHRFNGESEELLASAVEIVDYCVTIAIETKSRNAQDECGFFVGRSGIFAVAAAIYDLTGNDIKVAECVKAYIKTANYCARYATNDFLTGRAGYLAGGLWLNKITKKNLIPNDVLNVICESILKSGYSYGTSPLMYSYNGLEYLGAAYGLSSILLAIMSCDCFLNSNPHIEPQIKQSVEFLLSLQESNGNFPATSDEIGRERGVSELIHWCHGAPGLVYLFAKSYRKWGDLKYFNSLIRCGELTWQRGLLKKGPGLCHGIAGNGYVFLLLYRLSNDPKHLYRANEFAKFLYSNEFKLARSPDNPASLFEGYSGTLSFLADVMDPLNAAFPFMDIY